MLPMERTLCLVFLAVSCVPAPPPSLRETMLEQEIELDRLELAIEQGAPREERLSAARLMTELSARPSFDSYQGRAEVKPRAAMFRAFVEELRAGGDALVTALESDQDAGAAVERLRSSCDACHAVFRPDF